MQNELIKPAKRMDCMSGMQVGPGWVRGVACGVQQGGVLGLVGRVVDDEQPGVVCQ